MNCASPGQAWGSGRARQLYWETAEVWGKRDSHAWARHRGGDEGVASKGAGPAGAFRAVLQILNAIRMFTKSKPSFSFCLMLLLLEIPD